MHGGCGCILREGESEVSGGREQSGEGGEGICPWGTGKAIPWLWMGQICHLNTGNPLVHSLIKEDGVYGVMKPGEMSA